MPDSSIAGFLLPTSAAPQDDAALEDILQTLIVGVTGLPGNMVRPAWQPIVAVQPEPNVNWCAIQILAIAPDFNPFIAHDPEALTDTLQRHESINVLLSFYGPAGQSNASLARDGLYIIQNHDTLKPYDMALDAPAMIRSVPEQINQQWVRRFDLEVTFRRQLTRVYSVLNLESALIDLLTDTPPSTFTVSVTQN